VAPDPVRDLFFASHIGAEIAVGRSEHTNVVTMKHFDLCHAWRSPQWMLVHGMPKFSNHEWRVLDHVIFNGRMAEGYQTWTAIRGGQQTINKSLAYETAIDTHNVSRVIARLHKVGLLDYGESHSRESVYLTEHFHRMMFEVRWRAELRNSAPQAVKQILIVEDWKWMMERVDKVFRCDPDLSYTRRDDRRRALGEALYPLLRR
jgi:hypothetical protein